ncbi:MAG TPA: GNAT family N-acetyltransferase [Ktedonobacterales bacterium]|nr:GNAT family N-acetyltransferase [Ktedonobacterales bacterium]
MTTPMEREPQIVIRPFEAENDLPRLLQLLQTVETFDGDGEEVSEDALREQLTLPDHDPARDRWVAASPGDIETLVGWGFTWRVASEPSATLTGAVHPAWRRRGIGGALLMRALDRASELGAARAGVYANVRNEGATRFELAHGFRPVAANTLLRLDGAAHALEPAIPTGYLLCRRPEAIDLSTLAHALNRSYEGLWGHHVVSEAWVAQSLERLRAEDTLLLLFGPAGDVVGVCRVERCSESIPYIDAPGIVPEHRSARLYAALLFAACVHLRTMRPEAIVLESWGDTDETLAAYQALGFEVVRHTTAYERPL